MPAARFLTGLPLAIALIGCGSAPRDDAAAHAGQRLAGASADLDDALERAGLEPTRDGDETVLGTCPFHRLARQNPAVVCELNHAMLCGMAEAVGDDPGRVHLDAVSGGCCIRIAAAP